MADAAATWMAYLPVGGLVVARCAGVFALAPPLGMRQVPPIVRLGAAGAFGACLTPLAAGQGLTAPDATVPYAAAVCSEIAIGAALGFCGAIVFWAALLAGQTIDSALGAVTEDDDTGPFGTLYALLAVLAFLAIGGQRWLLSALLGSFAALPPGHALQTGSALQALSALPGQALVSALSIALPVLLALVAADVLVGLAARCAPALRGTAVAAPSRWVMAVLAAALAAPTVSGEIARLLVVAGEAARGLGGR
jgi:flagellar biosynthetic protein FliR